MENKIYINELTNFLNKEFISHFLVTQKELREGTKDYYLRLQLTDKSGNIPGNVWSNAQSISDKFEEGDVVQIKGIVISYKSQLQVTINKLQKIPENEYDLSDFLATTTKSVKELSDLLFQYIDNVKDESIKELLLRIYEDKEFFRLFSQAPAAKTWHHNYIGGLLEHTVSVCRICDFITRYYPLSRDLLIAGAILHDLGKVFEYNISSSIDFTVTGRLVGHISLGDSYICQKAAELNNFPNDILMKLRHLILSHHGEYEKAAARLPQTIEAVALHHADNMDAQITGVKQMVENVQSAESEWTEFDRLNNRFYFIG